MSEEAKLFLLKDRLESIRKNRRNYKIGGLVLGFILLLAIDRLYLQVDSIIFMILSGILFFVVTFGIDNYYFKEEQKIIFQIEQLAGYNQ